MQKLHLREQNLDFGDGLSYNLHTRNRCVKPKNSISDSTMSRRDFGALAAGGLSLVASAELEGQIPAGGPPLDIAEWSYFWVGVERADLARGTVVSGKQMYVEYQILIRSCWCMAAADKARIGWALRTGVEAGRLFFSKKATKFMSSTVPATAARLFIPICTARFRNRCSRSKTCQANSRRRIPIRVIRTNSGSCTISGRGPAKWDRRT